MSTTESAEGTAAPTRICRKCSTQAQTSGDFCPHCGARYAKKRRSKKTRVLLAVLPVVVLLAAGGVAAVLLVHHHNQVVAQRKAEAVKKQRLAAAIRAQKAAQAAAASRKKAAAKAEQTLNNIKRLTLVGALQNAVKKDAEKDVTDGALNGPILKVQCQPATAADARASIANYTCLAATSESNGELSGYRFSASINLGTESYTWHLGE